MIGRGTFIRTLVAVPLLAAGLALGAPTPAAAAFTCDRGYSEITIRESIVVPDGAACRLENVTVRGGVTAGLGASIVILASEVRGAVVATLPTTVGISGSTIRGGVTVTGSTQIAVVASSEVRGDVVFADNRGILIELGTSEVRGSATVSGNAVSGPVLVHGNAIDGNLDCWGNTPVPRLGGGNAASTVGGSVSPECAGLVAP